MRILTQHLLPHKLVSLLAHLSANCEITCIKNFLIRYFINRYDVKMQEAVETNPFAYPSYNHFFTRALKPECRPIDNNPLAIVSPADGALAQSGRIEEQRIMQAKGHTYSALELLGGDKETAKDFTNGSFATVYLAPKDYHRVHMPLGGKLLQMQYIPGKLFSVNTHAAENIPNLFARNERVVCVFETEVGKMAVILVGAMIVGSIETTWAGTISPPHFSAVNTWHYESTDEQHIELQKGEEMGRFKLGSTVIVLFEHDAMTWDPSLKVNMNLKLGQRLGTILT